ncbi:MAG: hypothetical protein QOG15_1877 [Solirubrobacteraceae bacterium]|jgi:hypothetical protein|nr:hypothetical protein [Solirubrobacteraceae bacterium]
MGALGRIGAGLRRLQSLQAPGGVADAHVFAPELDVTYRPRNPRRPALVQVSGGVIAGPGQNGHLELRVGPQDPPEHIVGALATRHEAGEGARIGSGGQLTAIVPAGSRYRLATYTVKGYETPEFVITTKLTETSL